MYLVALLVKYRFVNVLAFIFFRIFNSASGRSVKRRKQINLFDFKQISQPLNFYPNDLVIDNNFYGISYSIKNYIKMNKNIDAYIEHGLFIGSYVKNDSFEWFTSSIITFSDYRKKIIRTKTKKNIITIGPYIHYANDLLNEKEYFVYKKKLGKTILAFPSHSIKGINASYDVECFLEQIEKKRRGYDSVVMCLYWRDALNEELVNKYLARGFKIFTAGNIYDENFLSRLKSMIRLSDFTMSNFVGTHIGYCIYMKKPHWIFSQSTKYEASSVEILNREFNRGESEKNSEELDENEILACFENYSVTISLEQERVVDKFWGTSSILNPDQLKKALVESKTN